MMATSYTRQGGNDADWPPPLEPSVADLPAIADAAAAAAEVDLNGWSAEAEAALTAAYQPVIEYLYRHTSLIFEPAHSGGNIWNLSADLGAGREVLLQDGDGLRLDYNGEAEGHWSAVYTDGEGADSDEALG